MNFVVAHYSEAKSIINQLGLTKNVSISSFQVFQNDHHKLIISGIGKVASAAATGFLIGQSVKDQRAVPFLNVGIAGHGSLDIGTAFIANRIEDDEGNTTFYPPQITNSKMMQSRLRSCSHPNRNYANLGFDMEAHAFFSIASRSITRELVQVVKVVSDNNDHSFESITPTIASDLIEKNLPEIIDLVDQLEGFSEEISVDSSTISIQEKARGMHSFSQTQLFELNRLISHAKILEIDLNEIIHEIRSGISSKQALQNLREKLEPKRTIQ